MFSLRTGRHRPSRSLIAKQGTAGGRVLQFWLGSRGKGLGLLLTLGGLGVVIFYWYWAGLSRPLVVASGSMEPHLSVGSIALFRPVEGNEPAPGDVIAFVLPGPGNRGKERVVTHRIVSVKRSGGSVRYRTKGDANARADVREVPWRSVLGVEAFALPYLGYPLLWMRGPLGFALLVATPALILLHREVAKLAETLRALRKPG